MTRSPAPTSPSGQQRLAERQRPAGAAVMVQRWEHLAFLHWRFPAEAIQRSLPAGLTVDTLEGDAWVGLVPVFMRNVRPHFVPPIPFVSSFLELNLRTYVYDAQGRPGLYFYSLACDQALVVAGARRMLGLNYEHAAMSGEAAAGRVTFTCVRSGQSEADTLVYAIGPGPARQADMDTLEFFLIERYRLFARHEGGLTSIQVHHLPYRLLPVTVSGWGEHAFALASLAPPRRPPDHVCAAETVDLDVFLPEGVSTPAPDPASLSAKSA